jgi:hypothetical protein
MLLNVCTSKRSRSSANSNNFNIFGCEKNFNAKQSGVLRLNTVLKKLRSMLTNCVYKEVNLNKLANFSLINPSKTIKIYI